MRNWSVRLASWPDDITPIRAVRTTVFVREQQVPEDLEWDGEDEAARHFLAQTSAGMPVGTARLMPNGQIGRMAVLTPWRRKGVGDALLSCILDYIFRTKRYPQVFLNAQIQVVPFYARHGFRPLGPVFTEAGILHQRMELFDE